MLECQEWIDNAPFLYKVKNKHDRVQRSRSFLIPWLADAFFPVRVFLWRCFLNLHHERSAPAEFCFFRFLVFHFLFFYCHLESRGQEVMNRVLKKKVGIKYQFWLLQPSFTTEEIVMRAWNVSCFLTEGSESTVQRQKSVLIMLRWIIYNYDWINL